jgi:hypothetical protein
MKPTKRLDFRVTPVPSPVELLPPVITATKLLRPSMSRTDSLLQCSWPFGKEVAIGEVTERMRYGSAWHYAASCLLPFPKKKVDVSKVAADYDVDELELRDHLKIGLEQLVAWLRADNQWGIDFVKRGQARFETAVAYRPITKTARTCLPPTLEGHIYKGIDAALEFPGATDLVIDQIQSSSKTAPDLLVIDHKTGEDCDLPLESGQLKSLVLASSVRIKAKRPAGAIFHTPRGIEGGYIYADDFEKSLLKKHASDLKDAWQRIGDGSLKPGWHCSGCPAQTVCPAHTSALVELRPKSETEIMTPEKLGLIHQTLANWNAFSRKVSAEIIKPYVRQHGAIPRPDGKIVSMKEVEVENVSKRNVVDVEGAAKAEKVFVEWRKKGYLKKTSREDMRAREDD